MPFAIPNTTVVSVAYTDPLTFAGNDVFSWGYVTVANNPVFAQLLEGIRGQVVPQPEQYLPPATYPITSSGRPISGIRFRANSLSNPLPQVFGNLYYPNDPGLQAGTPFSGVVAAGGGIGVGLGIIDTQPNLVDVQGSAAETNLYSFLIPGGTLSANGILVLELAGDYLHNNVAANALTTRVRFGGAVSPGTLQWQSAAIAFGGILSATRHPWNLTVMIQNAAATNSQYLWVRGIAEQENIAGGAPGIGLGWDGGEFSFAAAAANYLAIDTSLPALLEVTVQWNAASANNSWRKFVASLENK